MNMGELGRTVRLGIIGLGGRGMGQTKTLLQMKDVEISVVCDVYDDRVASGKKLVYENRGYEPAGETDYRRVIERRDRKSVV